jgi:hypothetical protein
MTLGSGPQRRDPELLKALEIQKRLHDTLKLLFELLEKYAPVRYEKGYHDQANPAPRVERVC